MNKTMVLKNLIIGLFGTILSISFVWIGGANYDENFSLQAQKVADMGFILPQENIENYKVGEFISRREILKIVSQMSGFTQTNSCSGVFDDMLSSDWACKYGDFALGKGIISQNNFFYPAKNISKAESLKMILQAKNIPVVSTKVWQEGYIKAYVDAGFGEKFTDFNTPATRGFIFDVVVKSSNYIGNVSKKNIFELTFSTPMNRASVNENLKLSPKISYTSNWKNDTTLEIELTQAIFQETEILINILDEAMTQKGNSIANPIIKTFTVTPDVSVIFVSPDGSLDRQDQVITVSFNKPMVEMTNFDNMSKCPINIIPKLEGKCVWISSSTFQFRPINAFAKGGLYSLSIPSGQKALDNSTTTQTKNWQIKTSDFEFLGTSKNIQSKDNMIFVWNDIVDIKSFIKVFSLEGYANSDLEFRYSKDTKNAIEVYPKNGDFGYDKKYSYKIDPMSSLGGNISLTQQSGDIQTSPFLLNYQTFVLENEEMKNPYLEENMIFSQDNKKIQDEHPYVLLSFDKEMELDRSFFVTNSPYEIFYKKGVNEKNEIYDDKKSIVLKFAKKSGNINLNILISKISKSKDISLQFEQASLNTLESVKILDYKKACIVSKNPLKYGYNNLAKSIIFTPKIEVQNYLTQVQEYYTPDKNCPYQAGKNTYILYFQADPETPYSLEIRKDLLDTNNAGLSKIFTTSVTTPKAQNDDKNFYILDARENILIPKNISPLSIAVQSQNISTLEVEVCEGELDVIDGIKNTSCFKKNISVQNMKFKPYVSVLNLEEIFGKKFSKEKITVKISKIEEDKTGYEKSLTFHSQNASFLRSDIAVSVKNAINPELFIVDFVTGEIPKNLQKIEGYASRAQYGVFGDYKGIKYEKIRDITFNKTQSETFQLSDLNDIQDLLITLESGEKIVLSGYFSQTHSQSQKTIFQKSKPLYKPGDKVEIAGVTLTKTPEKLIQKSAKYTLIVRNPYYEEILKKEIQTDSVGAFEAEVKLLDDAPLGLYSVEFAGNSTSFQVQNYQKPEFEVTLSSAQKTYFDAKTIEVKAQAKTFIGIPLENATVNYTLYKTKKDFLSSKYPDYSFGEISSWWRFDFWGGGNSKTYVTGGKAFTDKNGNAIISIMPEKDENFTYEVQVSVIDPNTQKTIASNYSFDFYGYEKVVGIKTSKEYYDFGDTLQFDILTLLNNQNIASNTFGSWKISKKQWEQNPETLKFEEKISILKEQSFQTNTSGIKQESFLFQDYGQFELEVKVGNFITKKTFYIFGGNIITPRDQEHLLAVTSENKLPKIGETVEYMAHTSGTGILYVTVEKDGKIFESKVMDVKNTKTPFVFQVKKEWFPGFEVHAFFVEYSKSQELSELKNIRSQALKIENELRKTPSMIPYFSLWYDVGGGYNTKDLQALYELREKEANILKDIFPQYFVGSLKTQIDAKEKQLEYSLKMDKIEYLPKDEAKITLSVKDIHNKNVEGVISFVGIDASLLSLYNDGENIYETLYNENGNSISHFHNLTTLPVRLELNIDDEGISGGGGDISVEESTDSMMDDMDGGMPSVTSPNLMDKSETTGSSSDVRNNFVDSAFFAKNIEVKNGVATFTISKLPDNLTTWKILGYAISNNAEVSNISEQFVVKKPIAVFPNLPRFFLQGDSGKFGVEVQNTTLSAKSVIVNLSATGIEIPLKPQTIIVPANGKSIASFDFVVTNATQTEMLITANSGKYSDSMSISKPIYESKSQEYIYSNGVTSDISFEEQILFPFDVQKDGTLDISLGASVLHNLENILPKMISYPTYDAGSQIEFLAKHKELQKIYEKIGKQEIFQTLTLKDQDGEEKTLSQIQKDILKNFSQFVQKDSGIGYYPNCYWGSEEYSCSSLELTRDFLALEMNIENIENTSVEKYYKEAILAYQKRYQTQIDVKYFLPLGTKDKNFVQTHFSLPKALNISQKLDLVELSKKSGLFEKEAKNYVSVLKNDIMIEARGSFLNSESGNTIANTAKMIQILDEKNSLLNENMIRYILALGIDEVGYQEEVLGAISYYVNTQENLQNTSFSAKAYLNSQVIMDGIFETKNMFQTLKKSFTLSEKIWQKTNSLGFEKSGTGNLFYDIGVRYFLPTGQVTSRDEGIIVQRKIYDYDDYKASFQEKCTHYPWMYTYGGKYCYKEKVKEPVTISESRVGKFLVGEVEIILTTPRKNIVVQDFIPSGTSLVNNIFSTTSAEIEQEIGTDKIGYFSYDFDKKELYDDKVYLYADYLPAGTYKFQYVLQTEFEGKFSHKPALAELLDTPEIWGRSEGKIFEIKK